MSSLSEEAICVFTYVTKSVVTVHTVWSNGSVLILWRNLPPPSFQKCSFNAVARRYSRLKPSHQAKIFRVWGGGWTCNTSFASRRVHRRTVVAAVMNLHTHALNNVATYVFEMAKNSFCPSGGTLADNAVTSLRFSSI
jgi:hypothetical protein